jgi:5'-3' exonuclease
MGIQNINAWLAKTPAAAAAFRTVSSAPFEGTRVAVDAQLMLCAKFASASTHFVDSLLPTEDLLAWQEAGTRAKVRSAIHRLMYSGIAMFVGQMVTLGITPVFVFDGDAVPEKTCFARKRREAARAAIAAKIAAAIAAIAAVPKLHRPQSDIAELRKLVKQAPPMSPREDAAWLRAALRDCGVPVVQAPDEAEKMCATLCAAGVCSASWTTDTDTYLCGATVMLTGFAPTLPGDAAAPHQLLAVGAVDPGDLVPGAAAAAGRRPTALFKAVFVDKIFEALGVTREQFVDFAIMLGVDFNDSVAGIGPVKAWKLFCEARAAHPTATRLIEHIAVAAGAAPPRARKPPARAGAGGAAAAAPKPPPDFSVLNEERCRAIFLDASANFAAIRALDVRDLRMRASANAQISHAAAAAGLLDELPRLVPPHPLNCPPGVAEHVHRRGGFAVAEDRFLEAAAAADDSDGDGGVDDGADSAAGDGA